MNNEDEIEYFGFVPISFVNEIRDEWISIIDETANELNKFSKNTASVAKTIIKKNFEKNFFIFETFVLRNIFCFPKKFKLERKVTDLRLDVDLQVVLDKHIKALEEEASMEAELLKLKGELEIEKYKTNEYEQLLKLENEIVMMSDEVNHLKNVLYETDEIYNNFVMNHPTNDDEYFKELMECKEIKNEIYKKERDSIYHRTQINNLKFINKFL
ncbi:hypothetical protein TCON_0440 [Astathelohania contejeani]|uniref:Uncharacterized protein n=1 Tax=Astathelohania contejeani TaxID=164912 RepID=A0ABQ7I1P5_9MICR|nr:hypothetical protein TCON_0440 [Thelohania contejeani]